MVDPKNPGAVDEIIHLGDYWNEIGVRANHDAILKDNREVGRTFARAYRYLKAAASVYEDNKAIYGWAMDNAKANALTKKVIDDLFEDEGIAVKEGKQRHLFASAITPSGLKNYLSTVVAADKVYVVKGNPGTGTEKLLEKVRQAAIEKGYYVESYYCALFPDKLEHLVIPEKNVAFTTSNKYHSGDVEVYAEIDLNEHLDTAVLEIYTDEIEYNNGEFEALLNKTTETIAKAKALHDHMETYYIPNMDFEAVQRCWEATMARVLEYAKEHE